MATTYYGPESGIGILLDASRPIEAPPRRPGRIRDGTLATYGRPGDHVSILRDQSDGGANRSAVFPLPDRVPRTVDIVHGDARLTLDRQLAAEIRRARPRRLFGRCHSVHLLTVEAFAIYLQHLAPHGVIAVHISNRHFDLEPVVDRDCRAHDHFATAAIHSDDTNFGGYSERVDARRRAIPSGSRRSRSAKRADDGERRRRVLWTDDHASLVQVLWRTRPSKRSGPILRELMSDAARRDFRREKENETPE